MLQYDLSHNQELLDNKFQPLYNFWNQCKTNNNELCKELYTKINTIDKETFKRYRDTIIGEKIQINQEIMSKLFIMIDIISSLLSINLELKLYPSF